MELALHSIDYIIMVVYAIFIVGYGLKNIFWQVET